jgi:hypothetical protein
MSAPVRRVVLGICCLACLASLPALGSAAVSTRHLTTGVYRATVVDSPTHTTYYGTWNLIVAASGKIVGTSHWTCCPGKRNDLMSGHTSGTNVVIVRKCSGQGAGSPCTQTYTGTVHADGTVHGTWTGTARPNRQSFVLKRQ